VGTPDQTLLHNVATIDYADTNANNLPQESDYADVVVTAPVMSIIKTANVAEAYPTDSIIYTITYTNSGTGWATLVTITDTIPAYTTFVSSTPGYSSVINDTYTWNMGNMSPNSSGVITITVTVDVGTPDETVLHNVATLDYADANGNSYPPESDYADVIVPAPVMTLSKTVNQATADPGDTIVYTIDYENIGTGDAVNVTIVDTLPDDVTFISASLTPISEVGNILTWIIAEVLSGAGGSITVTVRVNPQTPDQTLLTNEVTLDYYDPRDNYIEQLYDSVDVTVTAPAMTLSKEAGNVTVTAYVLADFKLRIAGEKWHDVRLTLYDGNETVALASITRYPGDPDDQAVTIHNVTVNVFSDSFTAVIEYTPWDDPINGQWWGADPCWLILTTQDGRSIRLKHTFNVRHEETWIWIIDDFRPYLKGLPLTCNATIPYIISYANLGSGDATNVWVNDTFPANTTFLDSNPAYTSFSGYTYSWYIGTVAAGEEGHIYVNISYIYTVDGTLLTNMVSLVCSDANGNFFQQLAAYADVVLQVPEYDDGKGGKKGSSGYIGEDSDAGTTGTIPDDVTEAPLVDNDDSTNSDKNAVAGIGTSTYTNSALLKSGLSTSTDFASNEPEILTSWEWVVGSIIYNIIVTSDPNDGVLTYEWIIVNPEYADMEPEQDGDTQAYEGENTAAVTEDMTTTSEELQTETFTLVIDTDYDAIPEEDEIVEDEDGFVVPVTYEIPLSQIVETIPEITVVTEYSEPLVTTEVTVDCEDTSEAIKEVAADVVETEELSESKEVEDSEVSETISISEKLSSPDSEEKTHISGEGKAVAESSTEKVTNSYLPVFAALLMVLTLLGVGIYTSIKKRR
jgi:uncharacterized repeat protein (TIGR01451 family)